MKTFIKISSVVTLTSMLLMACQDKSQEQMETAPRDEAIVKLTKEQAAAAQIELGSLEKKRMAQEVRVNGFFDVPPQNKAQVSAYKAGYVKSTTLLVGDQVKKGQVIVVLENPEFVKVQQSFMEVNGQLDYLKAEFDRKKLLVQENLTAKKNLIKAEADYKTAFARHQGLKKELQMMGINIDRVQAGTYASTIAIRSPIGGTVTKVNATIGKFILQQEVILEVVNTEHLHVELQVFEKDVLKVKKGQRIKVRIPNLNEKVYEGNVYLVGKALDTETRTINVHAHVNEEAGFLPGMYVEADILLEEKEVVALPEEAIVGDENGRFIFVQIGEEDSFGFYKKVEVKTGFENNGWIEVAPLEPIDSAQKVLVKGVYYVSSMLDGEKGSDH